MKKHKTIKLLFMLTSFFAKNSFNTIHEAKMLPQVAEKARMAACHPKVVKLLMINLFEPIEMPKMNSRSTMVHEMVFLFL